MRSFTTPSLKLRKSRGASLAILALLLFLAFIPASIRSFSNGQAASVVLGQPGFTTSATATTATGMNGPAGVAVSSPGPVWVADQSNNRVLEFVAPFTNGTAASVVLGQTDLTHSAPVTAATGLNTPEGIAVDQTGNLWVADWGNNRVVEFVKGSGYNDGQPATVVLGQPDFIHSAASVTSTGMNGPNGVALDKLGNLWVADAGNNRILEFIPPFKNGTAASLVLGQPDFTHSAPATTATGLNTPNGLGIDSSNNVWVSDSGNNRVVEFVKGAGFADGKAATEVLGQPDFAHANPATGSTGMNTPNDVVVGALGSVWVADFGNNRILEFVAPFTNGTAASVVLGQPDLSQGAPATTAKGMNGPNAVALDQSGNVWVADFGNNRVLEFLVQTPTTTSVNCTPSSIALGSSSSCTARVSGISGPTGSLSWAANPSGSVSFSSASCILTSGSCAVSVTGLSSSTVSVTATYNGDTNDAGSSGSFTLTVYSTIQESLAESLSLSDSSVDTVYRLIQAQLTEAMSLGDSLSQSIYHTIQTVLTEGIGIADASTNSILREVRVDLTDSVNAADATFNGVFHTIQTSLAETVGFSDSSIQSIFHTIRTSLSDTVGVADSSANSILRTIRVALTDAVVALDSLRTTVTIPKLTFTLASLQPANELVHDSLGRSAGCTSAGVVANQIPGATVSGCGARIETVTVPQAVTGNWVVQVFGTSRSSASGSPFALLVVSYGPSGGVLHVFTTSGRLTPKTTESFYLTVFPDGRIVLTSVTSGILAVSSLGISAGVLLTLGGVSSRSKKRGRFHRLAGGFFGDQRGGNS